MRYNSREEVERIGRAGSCMRYVNDDDIAFRYLSSFWLIVERDDKAFTPHGPDGFWEAWITKWMSEQFEKHDYFIDVGANVGYYSILAAKAGMYVEAFEPNPVVAKMLTKTVNLNNEQGRVEVFAKALSNKCGTAFLSVPAGHSGGASLADSGEFEVDLITMDASYSGFQNEKALVKIDAEGAEPLIWAGMQEYFKNNDVTVILEWETVRFNAEEFAKSLLDDYQNSCFYVDTQGNEVPLVHWKQFEMLEGLQMVVVRKRKD